MELLLQWGIDLIVKIQEFRSPLLDTFFTLITNMGGTLFFILIIPLLYWCVNEKFAARLAIVFCISYWINSEFKDMLKQPRPNNLKPDIIVIGHSSGPGFPSGHAQNSLVLWTFFAVWYNKKWFYAAALILILFISFSRLYLGHHFPTDIIGGWILGIIVLLVYFNSRNKMQSWLTKIKLSHRIVASIIIPAAIAFISHTAWNVSSLAVLSGFSTGYLIMKTFHGFRASGTVVQKFIRYLIGLCGIYIIYSGASVILPAKNNLLYLPFFFICFWLSGIWVSLGAPWTFIKLKLAEAELNIENN